MILTFGPFFQRDVVKKDRDMLKKNPVMMMKKWSL